MLRAVCLPPAATAGAEHAGTGDRHTFWGTNQKNSRGRGEGGQDPYLMLGRTFPWPLVQRFQLDPHGHPPPEDALAGCWPQHWGQPHRAAAPWGRILPYTLSSFAPSPQAPYSSAYEKSLPSYEQVQRQASAQPRPRSCSQPAVQAKAEVHRELGGGQDPPQEPQPRLETSSWYVTVAGLGWDARCPHAPVKPVGGGEDVLGGGTSAPNYSPRRNQEEKGLVE